MRMLFSMETDGFFWMEKENEVYSVFDKEQNSHRFFNEKGIEIPEYTRPSLMEDDFDYDDFDDNENDETKYNKYGVACGDNCLIDINGNEIPATNLNCEDDCSENNRYYSFALLNEEQLASITRCGTAENILVDIYDTKTRKYVVKCVPECKLSISGFEGENEVIIAATKFINEYDYIYLEGKGTLIAHKGKTITVYDYYQD